MNRREFLAICAAGTSPSRSAGAADLPRDIRITRAVGFRVTSRRSKIAGKNSRLDVHGDRATDRMVRLYTNKGIEGIGNCRAGEDRVAELVGANPFDFYRPAERRMVGPLGASTMPLWDLAGKMLNKPAYELLGGAGPTRVPVYDGSIYFADLLGQYANRWQDRFRQEIDTGLALGHRAFKVKIGRGARWMKRGEGDARDVDVVKLIRKHAGSGIVIGVDANNAYSLAGTKRFLERVGRDDIAFVEEMFPEAVGACLDLKRFIKTRGLKTLIADGETQHRLEAYKPFIQAKAIDIFQGDMNRFGFEGIATEAAWAKRQGLWVAPHNWGSLVGFYMQLHVGRAITNFYRAEHDPLTNDVLIAEGYEIKAGHATVPNAPGFGLKIHEAKFATDAKITFDLKKGTGVFSRRE